MKSGSVARNVLVIALSVAMLLVSATSAWAVVNDYQARGIVSKGVTLAGHDLSGMNEAKLRSTIEEIVSTPMMRPVNVTGDRKTRVLDPKGMVTVNVDAMVDQAYAPRRNATLVDRVSAGVTGRRIPGEVKPVYAVDNAALSAWIKESASTINHKPIDATRTIVNYSFKIKPAVYGVTVDETSATAVLTQALTADEGLTAASRDCSLPLTLTRPKVLQSSFKVAIIVSLSRCRIYLYNGAKLTKSYPCAPGQSAWPTPKGDFVINSKQVDAPWYNPHSTWSASMPEVIPGGPGNPMGDRKIGINYPGVFMHGVPPSEYGSIGSHASHGCMRMLPSAVHDLFGRVNIGEPVFIRE